MTQQRITDALTTAFSSHSIVFWHDADGEFSFSVRDLLPEGIELLYLDDLPALAIKLKVERATPRARFLLYSAKPVPDPANDWLLDIRLRSRSFHADNASILLEDLGLTSQQLRAHLKERAKFLKSKDRVDRLKRWVTPNDAAGDLDRKMIAVLVKADQPEAAAAMLDEVLRLEPGHPQAQAMLRGIAAAGSGLLFAMAFRMVLAIKRKPFFLPFTGLVFAAIALLRWPLPAVMLAGIVLSGAVAYGLLRKDEA